jgi:hypothetical protein
MLRCLPQRPRQHFLELQEELHLLLLLLRQEQ